MQRFCNNLVKQTPLFLEFANQWEDLGKASEVDDMFDYMQQNPNHKDGDCC